MILGAEIGLLIYGLYALFKGEFSLGKGQKLFGWRARTCGALCLLPMPIAFSIGAVYGFILAFRGVNPGEISQAYRGHFFLIELLVLVCAVVLIMVLSKVLQAGQDNELEAEPHESPAQ